MTRRHRHALEALHMACTELDDAVLAATFAGDTSRALALEVAAEAAQQAWQAGEDCDRLDLVSAIHDLRAIGSAWEEEMGARLSVMEAALTRASLLAVVMAEDAPPRDCAPAVTGGLAYTCPVPLED